MPKQKTLFSIKHKFNQININVDHFQSLPPDQQKAMEY